MTSIWDAPVDAGADASAPPAMPAIHPTVPTVDPRARMLGTQDGPLLTAAGRGVRNGIPYGESEQARVQALNTQYLLRPDWKARLVAASRSALGR